MNTYKVLFALIIISVCSCKKQDKLESFTWIENNRNWIRGDSTKLEAIYAISISDNFEKSTLAVIRKQNEPYDFFEFIPSDSLKDLIYSNFSGKEYPEYYRIDFQKHSFKYDGNIFAIIYKFSNQPERIINYIPNVVPDSLLPVINMLENCAHKEYSQTGDTFPIMGIVNKYRHSMFFYFDPLPQPVDSIVEYYNQQLFR